MQGLPPNFLPPRLVAHMTERVSDFPWATLVWVPASILAAFISFVLYLDFSHAAPAAPFRSIEHYADVALGLLYGSGVLTLFALFWAIGEIRKPGARPTARHYAGLGYGVLHALLVVMVFFVDRTVT